MFYRKNAYGTVVSDIGAIIRKSKVFSSVFKAKDDIFIPPICNFYRDKIEENNNEQRTQNKNA